MLKLYRDNNNISFKSINIGGKNFSGPQPVINTETLIDKLNGATSVRVTLDDNSEITASIEIK